MFSLSLSLTLSLFYNRVKVFCKNNDDLPTIHAHGNYGAVRTVNEIRKKKTLLRYAVIINIREPGPGVLLCVARIPVCLKSTEVTVFFEP